MEIEKIIQEMVSGNLARLDKEILVGSVTYKITAYVIRKQHLIRIDMRPLEIPGEER